MLASPRFEEGRSAYFGFHLLGTSNALELSETDAVRLLCHSLLEHLDDQGLIEAAETLAGMVRFYQTPVAPPKALPSPQPIKARIGESRVRPVFPVTEEE